MKKPWFWKARKSWFITSEDGQSQINLGPDEKTAYDRWQEILKTSSIRSTTACIVIVQEFLLHAKQSFTSPAAFENHRYYLIDFVNMFGNVRVCDLKPGHVTKWLDGREWSSSTLRTAIARLKRCFAWAVEEKHIESSPFAGVKRPPENRRNRLISDDEHARMMTAGKKGLRYTKRVAAFRAVLIALRHSGARPSSVSKVTIDYVSPAVDAWVFAKHKTRGQTERPLVVYLSPCLQTLTKIAMYVRSMNAGGVKSSGELFRNADGRPWNANAIRCRMRRLRESLGLEAGAVAYAYRHTFATNSLVAGIDMATVAELMGHRSLEMLARHYAHLGQHKDHLRKAAAKAAERRNVT